MDTQSFVESKQMGNELTGMTDEYTRKTFGYRCIAFVTFGPLSCLYCFNFKASVDNKHSRQMIQRPLVLN